MMPHFQSPLKALALPAGCRVVAHALLPATSTLVSWLFAAMDTGAKG
jgi:hypothetical protein